MRCFLDGFYVKLKVCIYREVVGSICLGGYFVFVGVCVCLYFCKFRLFFIDGWLIKLCIKLYGIFVGISY